MKKAPAPGQGSRRVGHLVSSLRGTPFRAFKRFRDCAGTPSSGLRQGKNTAAGREHQIGGC